MENTIETPRKSGNMWYNSHRVNEIQSIWNVRYPSRLAALVAGLRGSGPFAGRGSILWVRPEGGGGWEYLSLRSCQSGVLFLLMAPSKQPTWTGCPCRVVRWVHGRLTTQAACVDPDGTPQATCNSMLDCEVDPDGIPQATCNSMLGCEVDSRGNHTSKTKHCPTENG